MSFEHYWPSSKGNRGGGREPPWVDTSESSNLFLSNFVFLRWHSSWSVVGLWSLFIFIVFGKSARAIRWTSGTASQVYGRVPRHFCSGSITRWKKLEYTSMTFSGKLNYYLPSNAYVGFRCDAIRSLFHKHNDGKV